MTLPIVLTEQALDLADQLRAQAQSAPPPVVGDLSPRRRAAYDRLLDAVNRLPRPLMVLGSLSLIASALVAPDWFQARMDALSDMPEALWWIIGAVLSLHFGARYQDRSQDFRREMAGTAPTTLIALSAPETAAAPDAPHDAKA
jgi:hypothetical protein